MSPCLDLDDIVVRIMAVKAITSLSCVSFFKIYCWHSSFLYIGTGFFSDLWYLPIDDKFLCFVSLWHCMLYSLVIAVVYLQIKCRNFPVLWLNTYWFIVLNTQFSLYFLFTLHCYEIMVQAILANSWCQFMVCDHVQLIISHNRHMGDST